VVKHEAMAIRASRLRLLGGADAELDAREAVEVPGPSERATDRERAHRALAALATLKRDEARALVLQAAGRTYAEIEAETGWSHTKVYRRVLLGRHPAPGGLGPGRGRAMKRDTCERLLRFADKPAAQLTP
jgi:DNA-directed RNA polymerase specialized sigma24 family protein